MHSRIVSGTQGRADLPVLYCFHHAGGSAASFAAWRRSWRSAAPLRFVELPGRAGDGTSVSHCINDVLADLLQTFLRQARATEPYAFYGHSLGALIAYRLAQELVRYECRPPSFLAVSGRRSPSCPLRHRALWSLDDESLVSELRRLGGVPEAILANPKWLGVFLPVIRADLRLSDEYRHPGGAVLAAPILALRGVDDPIVTREEIGNWRGACRGEFHHTDLPGGHFFDVRGQACLQDHLQGAIMEWAGPKVMAA